MPFGLDPERELVMRLGWLPCQPLRGSSALPRQSFCDAETFRQVAIDEALWSGYRFGFAQLAEQTPDLHFYQLVRLFNTPLVSLSSKDARTAQYALWGGRAPAGADGTSYCHLWYFRAQVDQALIALEYGYDGNVAMRCDQRSLVELKEAYSMMTLAMNRL